MRAVLFLGAGLATFVVDNGIFWYLNRAPDRIFLALAVATAFSVAFNYLVARRFVFKTQVNHATALPKFLAVHGTGLLLRYAIIRGVLAISPIPAIVAKWIADGAVYSAKYFLQRDFVFKDATTHNGEPGSDPPGSPAARESSLPARPL